MKLKNVQQSAVDVESPKAVAGILLDRNETAKISLVTHEAAAMHREAEQMYARCVQGLLSCRARTEQAWRSFAKLSTPAVWRDPE